MKLDDLQARFPDAAIEEVGKRREVVIYTGLTVGDNDQLVAMVNDDTHVHSGGGDNCNGCGVDFDTLERDEC